MRLIRPTGNPRPNLRRMQFRHTRRALRHLRLARFVQSPKSSVRLFFSHQTIGISDAYYCAECTRMEKDRDGCPKIVNIGASRKDLSYERRKLGMSVLLEHCVRELTPLLYQGSRRVNESTFPIPEYIIGQRCRELITFCAGAHWSPPRTSP